MKKFYVLMLCFFLVLFVGCTTPITDEERTELETKITELETKVSDLENSNASKNQELADKDAQLKEKDEEIKSLTDRVNELLKQLDKKPIMYSIAVYDIDGEELGNKQIAGLEGDKLIDALNDNFDVVSSQSDWGTYITSINGSIVDPNYYLACYENNEYASVGADDLVLENEDKIEYYNQCWNENMDVVDLTVDQLIYDFMKNSVAAIYEKVDAAGKTPFYDYYLTSAILMMQKLGYDQSVFNFDFSNATTIKETLEARDWASETTQNNFMKGGITLLALGGDTTSLATALAAQTKYNYWQAIVTKALNIENEVLTNTIAGWTAPTASGDASMMALGAYSLYMTKEDLGTAAIDATYAKLTTTGVDSWGVNAASTGLFIMGLCNLGLNPREYTVDVNDTTKTDAVEILTTYVAEGGLKWKLTDEKADLGYSTPQGIAALLVYKAMRDMKLTSNNCFSYLGTANN